MRLDQVAVLAGDPVALDHLRHPADELGDRVQLTRRGADADDRGQRVAGSHRVDLGVIATDDTGRLQSGQAFGDRGRGDAQAPGELGEAHPSVALKLTEHLTVQFVK